MLSLIGARESCEIKIGREEFYELTVKTLDARDKTTLHEEYVWDKV